MLRKSEEVFIKKYQLSTLAHKIAILKINVFTLPRSVQEWRSSRSVLCRYVDTRWTQNGCWLAARPFLQQTKALLFLSSFRMNSSNKVSWDFWCHTDFPRVPIPFFCSSPFLRRLYGKRKKERFSSERTNFETLFFVLNVIHSFLNKRKLNFHSGDVSYL